MTGLYVRVKNSTVSKAGAIDVVTLLDVWFVHVSQKVPEYPEAQ
jgi:hypothetical protein